MSAKMKTPAIEQNSNILSVQAYQNFDKRSGSVDSKNRIVSKQSFESGTPHFNLNENKLGATLSQV